jgi:hypothetical protein
MEAYPEEYTEPLSIAVGDDPDQMAEEIGRRFFRMTRRARQLYGAERSTVPWAINAQPLFDLAVRWAAEAGASDPTDIAREFQRRLRSSEFTYSLTPDLNESDEFPINRFLTETKEGHCELFATSMALMLRTLGIPSRLVTGYYSREWNATGGYYVVRESHAHAWVESLDPKRGWLTWDPTPESGLPTTTTITFWGELAHWFDAHRHNWYRWVIDLGRQEQRELFASLGLPAGFWHSVVSDIANDVREARHRARQIGIWGPLLIGLAVFAVILGAYLSSKITARWDQRGLGRRIVRNGAPRYYRDLLRWLRQRGHVRPLGQTPAEFARSILEVHPTWEAVDRITALYYRDRYAPQALGAEDRRQAEALLATLMR